MLYNLIFIFAFSVLIALCTGLIIFWYLLRQKQIFLDEALSALAPKIETPMINFPDEGPEMEKQIDERLDEIIATFKQHIPMIGMFLSQKKEEELRGLAKNELVKLLPALKQRYLQSVNVISNHAQDRFSKSQIGDKLSQLYNKLWKKLQIKLFWVITCVGIVLGLIEMGLFYLIFS